MNLSIYSIQAFVVLDTEGNRVLSKYYKPKGGPSADSKGFGGLKEQKAFEKGLFQKTKKAGGTRYRLMLFRFSNMICRRCHSLRLASRRVQAFVGPDSLHRVWSIGERAHDLHRPDFSDGRADYASAEQPRKAGGT